MDCRLFPAALLSSASVYAAPAPSPSPEPAESCGQVGQWLKPAGERPSSYAAPTLLEQLAAQQVVLLGETHDRADDHRWQLDVLTALHRQRKRLAIGFEMFPRRLQPVLDRWVAGELSEAAFLEQAEWKKVWGYDAEFYLPLFRFAREHRLPMLALNVDRKLVQQVSARGWDAVPESERQGVSRPTPSPARLTAPALKDGVRQPCRTAEGRRAASTTSSTPRLLWDRAMAEGIAAHLQRRPQDLVVGILGAGHIHNGHGVPHQLKSLGVMRQTSLMTWPSDHSCKALTAGLADAVFVIPPQPEPASPPPRLGVRLEMASDGVRIEGVMQGSLAEQTGLKAGDVVVQAAGQKPGDIQDMIRLVQRQPAGTWLPLQIRRGAETLEMVVRFPAEK
jgi:uncharacterized iron-regulated protein